MLVITGNSNLNWEACQYVSSESDYPACHEPPSALSSFFFVVTPILASREYENQKDYDNVDFILGD